MADFTNQYYVVYLRGGIETPATVRSNSEENAKEFIKQTTSGFGGVISIKRLESDKGNNCECRHEYPFEYQRKALEG